MTRPPNRIDPDSFKGKLYLLVVDKLVLAAIIAASFALYDHWKTGESRDYSEEVQKANYLREFVPIVVNDGDLLLRAQVLAALIKKQAIDAPAAFALTERLLRSGLTYSERPCDGDTCLRQREEPFLSKALVPLVPQGLTALLNQWIISGAPGTRPYERPSAETESSPRSVRYRQEAVLFWEQTLVQAINSHSDRELTVLDDDVFLGEYFAVFSRAARSPALQLTGRKLKALRLMNALEVLSRPTSGAGVEEAVVTQLQTDAAAYLMSLANQSMSEDRENVLSDVVRLLDESETTTATATAGQIRSAMSKRSDTHKQFLWTQPPN